MTVENVNNSNTQEAAAPRLTGDELAHLFKFCNVKGGDRVVAYAKGRAQPDTMTGMFAEAAKKSLAQQTSPQAAMFLTKTVADPQFPIEAKKPIIDNLESMLPQLPIKQLNKMRSVVRETNESNTPRQTLLHRLEASIDNTIDGKMTETQRDFRSRDDNFLIPLIFNESAPIDDRDAAYVTLWQRAFDNPDFEEITDYSLDEDNHGDDIPEYFQNFLSEFRSNARSIFLKILPEADDGSLLDIITDIEFKDYIDTQLLQEMAKELKSRDVHMSVNQAEEAAYALEEDDPEVLREFVGAEVRRHFAEGTIEPLQLSKAMIPLLDDSALKVAESVLSEIVQHNEDNRIDEDSDSDTDVENIVLRFNERRTRDTLDAVRAELAKRH